MSPPCNVISCRVMIVSLAVTYVVELGFDVLGVWHIFRQEQTVWFLVSLGILSLSLISSQLLSYHLRAYAYTGNKCSLITSHCTLGSQLWRYSRLMKMTSLPLTRRELWEAGAMRLYHTATSSVPLLWLHSYLVLTSGPAVQWWPVVAAAIANVISACVGIIGYRKQREVCCASSVRPSVGGIFLGMLWRGCEIASRILALILFAAVHTFWIFLVLGLHWICAAVITGMESNWTRDRKRCFPAEIVTQSYILLFSRTTLVRSHSKITCSLFHVVMCLENVTLVTIWLLYDVDMTSHHLSISVAVGACQLGAILGAVVHHSCKRKSTAKTDKSSDTSFDVECVFECPDCRTKRQASRTAPYHMAEVKVQENHDPKFCELLTPALYEKFHQNHKLYDTPPQPCLLANPTSGKGKRRCHVITTSRRCNRQRHRNGRACNGGKCLFKSGDKSSQSEAEFIWDDYDFQISDWRRAHSEDLWPDVSQAGQRSNHSKAQPAEGFQDPGYHSGLSGSSNDPGFHLTELDFDVDDVFADHTEANKDIGTDNRHKPRLFPYTCNDYGYDDTESAVTSLTSVSARVPFVCCNKCGHSMCVDNLSYRSTRRSSIPTPVTSLPYDCYPDNNVTYKQHEQRSSVQSDKQEGTDRQKTRAFSDLSQQPSDRPRSSSYSSEDSDSHTMVC